MISNTLENMSNDLSKNDNVNDYINQVPKENRLRFLDNAIKELQAYITSKTKYITKLFSSIFIVAMLISIVAVLFYQPMLHNELEKQNIVHEKLLDISAKEQKKIDNSDMQKIQEKLNDKTDDIYNNSSVLFSLLLLGLLCSLVAFILPAMILSFRNISLKKYKALLSELQDQRYIFLTEQS